MRTIDRTDSPSQTEGAAAAVSAEPTATPTSPGWRLQQALDGAAARTRSALDCDGVVIAWRVDGANVAVGANGLHAEELEQARLALERDPAGDLGFEAGVAVPMTVENQVMGFLHLLGRSADDQVDVPLADAMAGHVAVSLNHEWSCPPAPAEKTRQQTMLDQLVVSADDLPSLIPQLERVLAPLFGTVRIGLMFWDDERSVLQMVRGSFGAPDCVTAACQLDPEHLPHHIAALVFEFQQTYVIDDPDRDPGLRPEYASAFEIERLISAPLVVDGRPLGILHVTRAGEPFSAVDIEQCNEIAPRIALAVESTRMRMQLSQQREVEAVLSQAAVAIASGSETGATLEGRLADLRAVFGASLMALVPTEGDPLVTKDADVPAVVEQRLLHEAGRARDERAAFWRPRHHRDRRSAVLYVPVRVGTRLVGTLVTFRNRHESFTVEERQGLSRMADLIALSWASARDQQQRADLARFEERQRIADDLHDDVAQILFAAQMQLDSILEQDSIREDVRSHATLARALLVRGDTAIRHVIARNSRPSAFNLPDRLHEVVEGIDEEFMLEVDLKIFEDAAEASRRMPDSGRDAIAKVAREALVNTAKHAGPCRASMKLDLPAPDRLRLRVSDSGGGSGAQGKESSHGLNSLRRTVRRQGGWLRVTRGRPRGTVVTVTLPL